MAKCKQLTRLSFKGLIVGKAMIAYHFLYLALVLR